MNVVLKKYQEKVLQELLANGNLALDREGKGEVCIFQSPTGSGKTVVVARFIEFLIKERPKDDLCFIWLSVGKGGLHIQSKKALEYFFNGSPKVSLIDEEMPGAKYIINRNEVLVGNWSQLYNKDSKTGEWKNIVMKDGEKNNFREVIENTNKKRKIVLIIDESQIGHDALRTTEVKQLIDAEFVVEVSATPSKNREVSEVLFFVKVESEDVINEGMIKKELIINAGLEDLVAKMDDEDGSQRLVLEAAFAKRLELKKEFQKIGAEINPLVLIQIPAADQGERRYESALIFLKEKNETIENKKVGVWLSEKKTDNLVGIIDNDDNTNFLIFKQAIDTGWDCPRAHILVKLREPGNEVFEIQVVGRILRTPERKHYGNDLLDSGYIYSNSTKISVKPDEYKMNIIKRLSSKLKSNFIPIKLRSFYKSRLDYGDIKASFQEVFEIECNKYFDIKENDPIKNRKKLTDKGVFVDRERFITSILADTGISTKDFDKLEGELSAQARVKIRLSVDETEDKFYKFLENHIGSFGNKKRSAPMMSTAIYVWFKKYLGFKLDGNDTVLIQSAVMDPNNLTYFENVINVAVRAYEDVKRQDQIEKEKKLENEYVFGLPPVEYFNENTQEEVKMVRKFAMAPCYLDKDRSKPEQNFESFLEENESELNWWWKNGENKKEYFGIKYEYPIGDVRTFYPDYIIQTVDGRIGIVETKDEGDQQGGSLTKVKAEALQKWLREQNRKSLFGGIIINHNGTWLINEREKYNWSKCESDNWEDWNELKI
jgi:type III restriction enzyme